MKIYTYSIIDSNGSIADSISGLKEAHVYNIPYRDIGVVVSKLSGQIPDVTKEHVLKHEEVLERLMQNFTILPFKFLTVFNQEENVLKMMKEYYNDFKENLDRLRNKVEFGIRVIWPGDTIRNRIIDTFKKSGSNVVVADDSSVKNFVKERFEKYKIDKEFEDEADKCITLIDDFFSRFIAEKKLEKLKSDNLLLSASYLVEKDRQIGFKEAFERTRSTPSELKFLLSGPWPPYNFITLNKKTDIFNRDALQQNFANEII
jgi:glycosyltransferase involved in cell wall biosynthesis